MTDVTKQLADALEAIGSVCPYYPGDDAYLRKAYDLISGILGACRQQSCELGPICLGCEPKDECKPTGWMSIETAPKDGSSVLLYGENRCITGYWDRDQRWTDSAYGTMWDFDATHWMLLPPAPEKS